MSLTLDIAITEDFTVNRKLTNKDTLEFDMDQEGEYHTYTKEVSREEAMQLIHHLIKVFKFSSYCCGEDIE